MKHVLWMFVVLALSTTAYGQPASTDSHAATLRVVVRLQINQVSLTKARQLGIDIDAAKIPGIPTAAAKVGQAKGVAGPISIINEDSDAHKIWESLREDCVMKVLAAPTLVTPSGKTATFNPEDKPPVPKTPKDGEATIKQQDGIAIEVTPEVLGDDVRLSLHVRKSDPDRGDPAKESRTAASSERDMEFATSVVLKRGQTLVFRGPTEVRVETINRGLPYVSEVPLVGAIIRREEQINNEVATFILVRTEIMH